MSDNCNDCVQSKLVQKLEDRVSNLESEMINIKDKVAEVEKNTAVNEEQTKMVFKILGEIKDSIEKIVTKLDKIEEAPADSWRNLIEKIVIVLVTGGFSYFIFK